MIFGPKKMCASRKRRPMMRQFRNRRLISLGVALVATSKSLGLRAEQQVAHAAADQVRRVIEAAQALDDLGGVGIDLDRVLSAFAVRGTTRTPRNHGVGIRRAWPRQSERDGASVASGSSRRTRRRRGGFGGLRGAARVPSAALRRGSARRTRRSRRAAASAAAGLSAGSAFAARGRRGVRRGSAAPAWPRAAAAAAARPAAAAGRCRRRRARRAAAAGAGGGRAAGGRRASATVARPVAAAAGGAGRPRRSGSTAAGAARGRRPRATRGAPVGQRRRRRTSAQAPSAHDAPAPADHDARRAKGSDARTAVAVCDRLGATRRTCGTAGAAHGGAGRRVGVLRSASGNGCDGRCGDAVAARREPARTESSIRGVVGGVDVGQVDAVAEHRSARGSLGSHRLLRPRAGAAADRRGPLEGIMMLDAGRVVDTGRAPTTASSSARPTSTDRLGDAGQRPGGVDRASAAS